MIDNVLSRLEKVRSSGSDKWQALCPAHEDSSPSLSITLTPERVLFYCHAGCEYSEILSALSLESWQIKTGGKPFIENVKNGLSKDVRDALLIQELVIKQASTKHQNRIPLNAIEKGEIALAKTRLQKAATRGYQTKLLKGVAL